MLEGQLIARPVRAVNQVKRTRVIPARTPQTLRVLVLLMVVGKSDSYKAISQKPVFAFHYNLHIMEELNMYMWSSAVQYSKQHESNFNAFVWPTNTFFIVIYCSVLSYLLTNFFFQSTFICYETKTRIFLIKITTEMIKQATLSEPLQRAGNGWYEKFFT